MTEEKSSKPKKRKVGKKTGTPKGVRKTAPKKTSKEKTASRPKKSKTPVQRKTEKPASAQNKTPSKETSPKLKHAQKSLIPARWHVRRRVFLGITILLIIIGLVYEFADVWLDDNKITPDESLAVLNEKHHTDEVFGEDGLVLEDDEQEEGLLEEKLYEERVAPEEEKSEGVQDAAVKKEPESSNVQPISKKYAWQKNAISVPVTGGPLLVIVIDDLGLHSGRLEGLMGLKMPLTLSFLPYAKQTPQLVQKARRRGFEIMVHVPMQPKDAKINSGPDTLRLSMSKSDILRVLKKNLEAFDGAVGINNHMGSAFTESEEKMTPVIRHLKAKEMIFLDSQTSSRTKGHLLAKREGVHALMRDVFIDHNKDTMSIKRNLHYADKIARKKGYAVAIGHPYSETIKALKEWSQERKKDVTIIPASMLVRRLYKL